MVNERHFNQEKARILGDTENEAAIIAELMMKMNGFVSIEAAETITTLDKTTQYRERRKGKFPAPIEITSSGRRKAYRINDLLSWIKQTESL